LALRALIGGDSNKLSASIKDEGLRDSGDVELLLHGVVAGGGESRQKESV
jgi:hypothetical protein